ncbi:HAMP domain-containing protein [Roseospira marina]|uniref:histidine kinase n=1 Tax=Roseospira marina TaxID=140057 RepID=A0A5M6IGS6_9PROT|nr:ATP-binding protein [Roseospira marina]KAA5606959.1 HAMP domain-containing protein [Roseospira marina]MBB4312863.1 two-component system osmolarity sensor histidine kinase EnvZ [Roseospira marina]MBB5086364.1 two-component system osmolarity sensor histidine kinase EnvZ [Roseospira marina]
MIRIRPFRVLKRLAPRDLMARSLLIIVIPMLLLQIITAYVFFDRHWDIVSRRLNTAVASEIGFIARLIHTYPGEDMQEWAFSLARISQGLVFTLTPGGRLPEIPPQNSDPIERALAHRLGDYIPYPFVIDPHPGEGNLTVHLSMAEGLLSVTLSKERLFTESIFLFVFWMASSSMVLFGVAAIFMRNQVRPMLRLARAADAFGKGREAPNLKVAGATEVRQAARAFIAMRDRIRRQIDQRTGMLAGVSHDLRTPLTRMKLQLALLEGTEGVEALRADIAEMERMIEAYLDFARGTGTEVARTTDLNALLQAVVARHRRAGARIDLTIPRPLTLPLKPQAFERCVGNLIGNAVRHGTRVMVSAVAQREHAEVLVDDDGPGIPPDQRETMFKAFQRLEQSRNQKTGGIGLGLTIARDLARGMGGEIALLDSPYGGLRVRLTLPL